MGKMQVANCLFLFLIISIFCSCNQKMNSDFIANRNHGGYSFHLSETKGDSLTVNGFVYDLENKNPLGGSSVNFYCETFATDSFGFFTFKISGHSSMDYFFKASSIGYQQVTTDIIYPMSSSSIDINFYLDVSRTPIYHCE